jgi:hypothetical protein
VGGLAGGTKFILRGAILFKMPVDALIREDPPKFLFGGSTPCQHLAHKSAGRELTAFDVLSMELIATPELVTPLSCLVDYRGRRVLAVAMLPLSKETLVQGSADGGRTVLNTDVELDSIMARVADSLHLAPHLVR